MSQSEAVQGSGLRVRGLELGSGLGLRVGIGSRVEGWGYGLGSGECLGIRFRV